MHARSSTVKLFSNLSPLIILSEQNENDLWYEFDNYYMWKAGQDPERRDSVRFFDLWSDETEFGSLTTKGLKEFLDTESAGNIAKYVNKLSPYYIEVFERYFGPKYDLQRNVVDSFPWKTFVDIGLGRLYDPREPRSDRGRKFYVHVMDGGTGVFMRWHRFNWVASILIPQEGTSQFAPGRWLYLDRLVGIACELQSLSKPRQSRVDGSKPENPSNGENITIAKIREISSVWLELNFDDIERRLPLLENWTPGPA